MVKVLKYSDWADTAQQLHMLLQIIGKTKLALMPPQPEWNHVVLHMNARGFTTGLIPTGEDGINVTCNLRSSMIYAHRTNGAMAGFPLRNGTSVSEYFDDYKRMLATIGVDTGINPVPQEVADTAPFAEQAEKHDFDSEKALEFYDMCVFAYNAMLAFASPFRSKKILPSYFWGTFDLSTILFSGEECPCGMEGIIEKNAFDEKFVEFGFWPGDANMDEPSFFAMPYPFIGDKDYTKAPLSPQEAFYSPEKKEFFLPFRALAGRENPVAAFGRFGRDVMDAICYDYGWEKIEWFKKPLYE